MFQNLINSASFFLLLFNIDKEIAMLAMTERCQFCGGPLHVANYPRKPRGVEGLNDGLNARFSFCCGNESCRKRHTPPSVRFLGRRVYAGFVVVLAAALQQGLTPEREATLQEFIPKQTLSRWLSWWQTEFKTSAVWRDLKAYFTRDECLPKDWLHAMTDKSLSNKLEQALKHLSRLSTKWAFNVMGVIGTQKL